MQSPLVLRQLTKFALQPASSGLGAATLNRLKRISMIRSNAKPRTIGSGTEFDAMLADSGLTRASLSLDRTTSSPKVIDSNAQVDGHGNKILGGELVVKVSDAQVCYLTNLIIQSPNSVLLGG